jgi:hypothetical protein
MRAAVQSSCVWKLLFAQQVKRFALAPSPFDPSFKIAHQPTHFVMRVRQVEDHEWLLACPPYPASLKCCHSSAGTGTSVFLQPHPASTSTRSVPSGHNVIRRRRALQQDAAAPRLSLAALQSPASKRASDYRRSYFQLLQQHVYHE